MAWVYLLGLALVLWGVCGATIAIGRRIWSLDTTLRIHLVVAPVVAFLVSTVHGLLVPEFDALLRAAVITGVVIVLDAVLVAPLFERSYAMFRSLIGTWIPFALIFLASWAAGILMPT
jgi:Na+-transporting NADH:ubiquinone oxidoreductase subunit NqrD